MNDRSTKLLLLVIAVSLVWIGIKDMAVVEPAMASNGVIKVEVVKLNAPPYQPLSVAVQGKLECE